MVQLIKKIRSSSSQSLYKAGIDRDILIQDLNSIALGNLIPRKSRVIIDFKTVTDYLLTQNTSPLTTNNSNKTYTNINQNKNTTTNYFNFWSDL